MSGRAKMRTVTGNTLLALEDLGCELGGRTVLRGVDLRVEEGETVVLLGRSGSGKSTLLKVVNGVAPRSKGEVRFEGRRVEDWDLIQMRRRMGYVIQDSGLFPHWTVEANVGLVPRLDGWKPEAVAQRVEDLLNAVGLPPDEFRSRRPRELSGGQKQRVGIARALAADPPLLLMDEPFGALDPITRFELQRQFLELRRRVRKTALFVTHDVREALMLGTRIALLKDGAIELLLPPEEFRRASNPEARQFLAALDEDGRRDERAGE